ncbi:MAG: hypothetical protein Q9191_007665 [Dirinaria sp. TL-2023a]
MVSESLQSPNAIPPRTSSSNNTNAAITSSFLTSPTPTKPQSSTKPILKPLPEGDWIAQRNRMHSGTPSTSTTDSHPVNGPTLLPLTNHSWTEEKEKILRGPFDYMDAHPGKNIRKQLIDAFNTLLHVPAESLAVITDVIGMLHTASLLVDDVEDSSLLRRGIPVAHSIFGTAQTINSANYIYFQALQALFTLQNPAAVQIYTEELLSLHRGQGMDLFWRDTLTCPSEADYLAMVDSKTGGLFRLAVRLMQTASPTTGGRDFVPLVNTIGLLFQIRDDLLNLCDPLYTNNKGLCEDLTEGKFSFPVIHAIRTNPSNLQLINILKQKTTDDEVKRYAVRYMEERGSFEYTRKVIAELRSKAVDMVEAMQDESEEGKRGVREILDKMGV